MQQPANKHTRQTLRTRQKLMRVAEALYGERGIHSVSLNEIVAAAGQKNRNALQYHFGSREDLLQAIVDRHSERIREVRLAFIQTENHGEPAAEFAARAFIIPLMNYIEENPSGVHYVKILSQLSALNIQVTHAASPSAIQMRPDLELRKLIDQALQHLGKVEARRRKFLSVSIAFHGIADIYRDNEQQASAQAQSERKKMIAQLICALQALYSAPPMA